MRSSYMNEVKVIGATLPRPPLQSIYKRSLQLSKHRIKQLAKPHAFIGADSASLIHTATVAVCSSALTSVWIAAKTLRTTQNQTILDSDIENIADTEEQQSRPFLSDGPEASSADDIWEKAWVAFSQTPTESSTSSSLNRDDEALQAHPLLWLQGIRHSQRTKLLSLSLAALEEHITALSAVDLLSNNPELVTALCKKVLAKSTLTAASAWLGYVPRQLQVLEREQQQVYVQTVESSEGSTNQGTLGSAPIGTRTVGNNSFSGRSKKSDASFQEDEEKDELLLSLWYMLEQRLGLYCSVFRLLKCTTIQPATSTMEAYDQNQWQQQQQQQQQRESPFLSNSASTAAAIDSVDQSPRQQAAAQLLLHSKHQEDLLSSSVTRSTETTNSIRGWTASSVFSAQQTTNSPTIGPSSSSSSSSQLLSIAPSILQDMAVLVADAVAAAYLDDVGSGLDVTLLTSPPRIINSSAEMTTASGAATKGYSALNNESSVIVNGNLKKSSLDKINNNRAAVVADDYYTSSNSLEKKQPLSLSGSSSSSSSSPLEFSFWPTFTHPKLNSTRQLQRFSNLVTLHRWADANLHSVAAIAEDRLPLFTLGSGTKIRMLQAPLRRGAELDSLQGLPFAISLLLEAVDLLTPMLRMLWERAGAALTFLLTIVVGKTLGLIYKGICMGTSGASMNFMKSALNTNPQKQAGDKSSGFTKKKDNDSGTNGSQRRRSSEQQKKGDWDTLGLAGT